MDPYTPQPQLPTEPVEPMLTSPHRHFLNKKFAVILAVIVTLSIPAYGAVWQYSNQQSAKEVAPIFTPRPDATAGWKTYTNTKYGFEFKYPSNFRCRTGVEIATGQVLCSSTAESVVVEPASTPLSDGWTLLTVNPVNVGRESVFDISARTTTYGVAFAGKHAKEYSCPKPNACPDEFSHIKAIRLIDLPSNWGIGNEIDYDITINNEASYLTAEQILSTFKFTN